jgi:hypothetical protein
MEDDQSADGFRIEVQDSVTSSSLLVGASLAERYWSVPEGRVYLDPSSFQSLYAGPSPAGGTASKEIELPPEFSPNYRMRPDPGDPAPPGSRALGLPFTFQAAIIENGSLILSLPYTIIY